MLFVAKVLHTEKRCRESVHSRGRRDDGVESEAVTGCESLRSPWSAHRLQFEHLWSPYRHLCDLVVAPIWSGRRRRYVSDLVPRSYSSSPVCKFSLRASALSSLI